MLFLRERVGVVFIGSRRGSLGAAVGLVTAESRAANVRDDVLVCVLERGDVVLGNCAWKQDAPAEHENRGQARVVALELEEELVRLLRADLVLEVDGEHVLTLEARGDARVRDHEKVLLLGERNLVGLEAANDMHLRFAVAFVGVLVAPAHSCLGREGVDVLLRADDAHCRLLDDDGAFHRKDVRVRRRDAEDADAAVAEVDAGVRRRDVVEDDDGRLRDRLADDDHA